MGDKIKKYGEKAGKADGDAYINSETKREYVGFGKSRADSDLIKRAVFASGTTTVTGSGGDVTVTLPWDWTGGKLELHLSKSTSNYFETTTSNISDFIETTYLALTDGTFTGAQTRQSRAQGTNNELFIYAKTRNMTGNPKAATTTSFTLDDSGVTAYVKWFVWA